METEQKGGMREESVDPKNDREDSSVQRIGKAKMTVSEKYRVSQR
jgi:hypothetical protein